MEYIYFSQHMSKEGRIFMTILKAIAIIGGAFIFIELMKMFAKKEVVYSCPNCKNDIRHSSPQCPNCHVKLSWKDERQTTDGTKELI